MSLWKELSRSADRGDDNTDTGATDPTFDNAMKQLASGLEQPPTVSGLAGVGDLNVGLAAINGRDPDFRAREFLDDVEAVYLRFQSAWQKGQQESLANAINTPYLVTFNALMAQWKSTGRPVIFDSPAPPSFRLQNVVADTNYDQIDVHITSPATPGMAFGEFRNIWIFIRYHVGDMGSGTMRQATCPRCGAPYSADAGNHCTYCGAVFSSTVFYWLLNGLSDITSGGH